MRPHIALVGPLVLISPAVGQAFEGFEGGSNAAGWSFGAPIQGPTMPGGFGSPWYYRGERIETTLPRLRCANNAAWFTGDYRVSGVYGAIIALNVIASDSPTAGLTPAVILVSTNGTPADPSDDWGAFTLTSQTVGGPGAWRLHGFTIPASSASLPASWHLISLGPNSPANPSWSALVTQVDRLEFSFGDPSFLHVSQTWTVGADFIWLPQFTEYCVANCDGSTASPFLNVNDFVCFNELFAAGDTLANCDRSVSVPLLNVNDFICFLNMFAAGCSAP